MSSQRSKLATMAAIVVLCIAVLCLAATVVPNEIQQPGTQQKEVRNLETPDRCDNCHGGYNSAVEPAFNWRGSMMANASRDPLFWATLAVAEQDFPGVGDLCIRCHSTAGWYAGRSTPTDGSALTASDADGVECDTCHKMTNTDNSEHRGVMIAPFIANDRRTPPTGYYGSGMLSLWGGNEKLGPYADASARHQSLPSRFHRMAEFCGSCHDVSNPAVGDLAHNHGKQPLADPVRASGRLGAPITEKAAFNNFPYQYGIVERTFSEFKAGLIGSTLVRDYGTLPQELQAGAIRAAYEAARGNYADGTPRYFTCQTCHMRAVTGQGCNKAGAPVRTDLPLHDMTGGNYWAPEAILWQNARGLLRLGGGLTAVQVEAIRAGQARARQQLSWAASLQVLPDNKVRIVNLTGHKLITGYPEGRRMWLNIRWYDSSGNLVREDGKYDWMGVNLPGYGTLNVKSILDLNGTDTRIYEAHYAMTKTWAQQLIAFGYPDSLPLAYDRITGSVKLTLGQLAQGSADYADTFHFVLNNHVSKDNRIPPYGMRYEEARKRNVLPVPLDLYLGSDGTYRHWDELTLNPPTGAVYAEIRLLYQPTSWEYIQFLYLANTRGNPFLASEGEKLLQTWLNTGMAEPYVMASATWGTPPRPACSAPGAPANLTATADRRAIRLAWTAANPPPNGGYRIYYAQAGKLQLRAGVSASTLSYLDSGLSKGTQYCYVVRAWNDCNGNQAFDAGVDLEGTPSPQACAVAQ
jgi:hypothetical protein